MNIDKINLKRAYEVSVKGLYQDFEGKVLVIRDEDGFWELPGGGLDHGEDIVEGLKRECLEELGVTCDIVDDQPYKVWVGKTPKGVLRLILLFRIRPHNFDFKPNKEAEEFRMVSKAELEKINLVPQLNKLKEII